VHLTHRSSTNTVNKMLLVYQVCSFGIHVLEYGGATIVANIKGY
jgi:hypothetical protein